MKIISKLTTVLLINIFPTFVYANDIFANKQCKPKNNGGIIPDCIIPKDLLGLLGIVIEILMALVGTISVLFIIIGGFQYITSAGNYDNIRNAKNTITYAIIGLVASLMSFAVITFIIDHVGQ